MCSDIDLCELTSSEYLALKLKAEMSVLIPTLCLPPRYPSVFTEEFSELIAHPVTRYNNSILNGDLNIHINKKNDFKLSYGAEESTGELGTCPTWPSSAWQLSRIVHFQMVSHLQCFSIRFTYFYNWGCQGISYAANSLVHYLPHTSVLFPWF